MCKEFNIGSFNVRGLSEETKQKSLAKDMMKYNVDVCCMQEMKISNGIDINIEKHRLISLPSECKHYGNGFIVSPKWKDSIYKYWKVSDRISVLQLISMNTKVNYKYTSEITNNNNTKVKITKTFNYTSTMKGKTGMKMKIKKTIPKHLITIINVYAPHTARIKNDPTELDEMYDQLSNLVNEHKNSSLLLVAGDFNAKVGKTDGNTPCLGRFSRGIRNASGQNLIDFNHNNDIFVTNSAFQHPARHITTWECHRVNKTTNKMIHVFNQIDYILCLQKNKNTLVNSRSYAGTATSSDHRLIVTRMKIDLFLLFKPTKPRKQDKPINSALLINDPEICSAYKTQLSSKLSNLSDKTWPNISEAIRTTAEETVGRVISRGNNVRYNNDIDLLSKEQKQIRLQLNSIDDPIVAEELRHKRNEIMHEIRRTNNRKREIELDQRVQEINEIQNDAKMYKAINILKRKKFENPFIHDDEGKRVTNSQEMYNLINDHFKKHFF